MCHDVFVIGGLVLDLCEEFDRYPQEGEEVFSPSLASGIGGTAYNVARTIKHHDLSPLLVAYIGSDPIGKLLQSALSERGIKTHFIVKEGVGTGTVFSVLTPHDRTMFTYRGADSLFSFTEEMVEFAKVSRITYISSYTLMGKDNLEEILGFLKRIRPFTTVFFSVARGVVDVRLDWIKEIARYVDSICMNEEEYMLLGEFLPESLPKIVTQGRKGAEYIKRDERIFIPQREEVTKGRFTGAGDAFCGGFIAGIVKGLSIEEVLEGANNTALSWIKGEFI